MSRPLSAKRAIDSAGAGRFVLEVFFIKLFFLRSRLPQSHQVIELSTRVFPDFVDQSIQATLGPADGAILERLIFALILVVRMTKDFLRFFKTDPTFRILSEG